MPPPDPIPDFSKTMRLLSANVVVGFVAGPLLLVALVCTVTHLYDSSPESLVRNFRLAEFILVSFGFRWAFISSLFCILVWLPLWLTQAFHFVFRKASSAAFVGMLLGLVSFTLFNGGFPENEGSAFAGGISGIAIFLLSRLFRERPGSPSIHPSGR